MLNEEQEALHAMLPDDEDAIYVSKVDQRLFVVGVHKCGFKCSHGVDGIAGCYSAAHGCARDLEAILPIELKVRFGQNQI